MKSFRPASIITVHADGLRTTSTRKQFAPRITPKPEKTFIPSHEFVGAEMPLFRAIRQLATDRFLKINQSVITSVQ